MRIDKYTKIYIYIHIHVLLCKEAISNMFWNVLFKRLQAPVPVVWQLSKRTMLELQSVNSRAQGAASLCPARGPGAVVLEVRNN